MTRILQTTTALLELLEMGDLQNGKLLIKEQTVPTKVTSCYDKIFFNLLQSEIAKDNVGDAIQNAQSVVQTPDRSVSLVEDKRATQLRSI